MRKALVIGMAVIGLMFAGVASGASTSALRHALAFKNAQLHRDRGTIRFGHRRPWAFHYPGFRRAYRAAARRVPLERRQRRRLLKAIAASRRPAISIAPWQATVNCENSGQWSDSPGYFYLGLQFDPGSWSKAASHTGVWGTSPVDQVINATWLARHSTNDPWPNCPDPYFG